MSKRETIVAWAVGILLAVSLFSCSETVAGHDPAENCTYSDADSLYVCGGTEFHIY